MSASLRDRATRPMDQAPAGLGDAASVPSADYPDGAIARCEEFILAVLGNGRQQKTPVYFVSCGGNGRPIAPQIEMMEFIWPLKFSDELEGGDSLFAANVHGYAISLRDRHITPNDYNRNFAFLDKEKAEAYADAAAARGVSQ